MKRAKPPAPPLRLAAMAMIVLSTASLAHAGPFLSGVTRVSQGTASLVDISGFPNETFQITYIDGAGATKTKNVTTVRHPVSAIGLAAATVPAKKGTTITVKNLSQPTETPQSYTAQRFTPGAEEAVTTLAMNPGSTLTAFGQTFSLGGNFTTIATSVDYDPASLGYGTLGGHMPSSFFDVFAEIGLERIDFELSGSSTPFSLNVASTWDADMPDTGLAVPFTQLLSGNLIYQGISHAFTGSIQGTTTFFGDNYETIAGNIILDGIGTGVFSASGRTLVTPEPATLMLLCIGIAGLGLWNSGRLARAARPHDTNRPPA